MDKILRVFFIVTMFFSYSIHPAELGEVLKDETSRKFKESGLFLVHIGFNKGLPENGYMEPSEHDPAIYFSVNSVFPKTKLMPRLDAAPYILIVPYEYVRGLVLSFHPTEVLLADGFYIGKNVVIIAPEGAKIPDCYPDEIIKRYTPGLLEVRNAKALEVLKGHIQVRSATRCKFSLKASRGVNHPKDFLGVVL